MSGSLVYDLGGFTPDDVSIIRAKAEFYGGIVRMRVTHDSPCVFIAYFEKRSNYNAAKKQIEDYLVWAKASKSVDKGLDKLVIAAFVLSADDRELPCQELISM